LQAAPPGPGFRAATRLLRDRLNRDLERDAGMPLSYYEVLVVLSETPERTMRMSELADRLLVSRSRLSHAVARIEDAGWVRREPCATDRRGSFAVLTEEGLAALEAAAPDHVDDVRRHLFDQLTDEQVVQLRTISEALYDHLTALRDAERP
jgi:DNA-binding MarR family transcriptional regulator